MFGTTTRRLSQLCLDGLVANADVIGHFHLRRVISEAGSWLDPVTIRLSGPCQPRNVATCLRRVQSGAGKAHKTPQPRRRALYRNRPHSAELRADESRSRRGMASELRTNQQNWSSIARLCRASWTFPSIWPCEFTICTSTRRSRHSLRERLGVSPMRSRVLSRSSILFPSSGRRRSSRPFLN